MLGSAISGTGNDLANAIVGTVADNILVGGAGDDVLDGGEGLDQMIGGTGNDTYFADSIDESPGLVENVGEGIDIVFASDDFDLVDNVENLTLVGDSDLLGSGNELNNVITGNIGANALSGGGGKDTLTGGAEADEFIYETFADFAASDIGSDTITDFVSGTDKIVLSLATFTALSSEEGSGFTIPEEFAAVTTDPEVAASDALIVFSLGSRTLFYNENATDPGLGTGANFATFTNGVSLSATDFEVVL